MLKIKPAAKYLIFLLVFSRATLTGDSLLLPQDDYGARIAYVIIGRGSAQVL
ncbi:MAG: hypothetical protein R6U91_07890 [Bacillota bacterium]